MAVIQRKDTDLSEALRHDADRGPVVTPHYAVLKRGDLERLVGLIDDELDFKIAWERRKRDEPITATWDEMREKYGL